jgi:hypothetical protein
VRELVGSVNLDCKITLARDGEVLRDGCCVVDPRRSEARKKAKHEFV